MAKLPLTLTAGLVGNLDDELDVPAGMTVVGSVSIDADAVDTTGALTITREPGSSAAVVGISLTLGANASNVSKALTIVQAGAGGGIGINSTGTSDGQAMLDIRREETASSSGSSIFVRHNTFTTGSALLVQLLSSPSSGVEITGNGANNLRLLEIHQESASNTAQVGRIINEGSGTTLSLQSRNGGTGLVITSTFSTDLLGKGIHITSTSPDMEPAVRIEKDSDTNVLSGHVIELDYTGMTTGTYSGNFIDIVRDAGNDGHCVSVSGTMYTGAVVNASADFANGSQGVVIDDTGTSNTGNLLEVTAGTNNTGIVSKLGHSHSGATGKVLEINQAGTGQAVDINVTNSSSANPALRVDYAGTTEAVIISHTGSTGTGLSVTNSSSSNTVFISNNSSGAGMTIQRAGSGSGNLLFLDNNTNNSNHCLRIDNGSTSSSSDSIEINHSGAGKGIDLNHTGTGTALELTNTSAGYALYITNSTTSTGLYMSHTGTGSAVDINNSGGGTALIVDQNYTSGDVAQFYGAGGSITQINGDCSFRQDTNGTPSAAFTINNPDSGMSSADSILTMACNQSEATLFEWIECISSGSDIESRHEAAGDWHTDSGVYTTGAGDYAESLETEEDKDNYEEGDVMVISSEGKVDKSGSASSSAVIGVYSTNPSVLGNNPISCALMDQGILETETWTWAVGEGPNYRTWTHVQIDGDRTADYTPGAHCRMEVPYSNVCLTTLSGVYDSGADKTSVYFSQTFPDQPSQTELYYAVPERNNIPVGMLGLVPTKCITENGTINPGDLLVTSTTSGCAMKAPANPAYGTVLGKAFELLTDTGSQDDLQLIDCLISI